MSNKKADPFSVWCIVVGSTGVLMVIIGQWISIYQAIETPGITERNYERIEGGMPLREVCDLMGEAGQINGPPNNGMTILRWENLGEGPPRVKILTYMVDGLVYHKCLWVDDKYTRQEGGYTP